MLSSVLAQGYQPHGMCYLWEADLVWLHAASDMVTTLAYWGIFAGLVVLVVRARRKTPGSGVHGFEGLPFGWMFLAFAVLFIACGATHAMGIWTIWEPRYWLEGGIKATTALASIATAIALPPLIPRAIDLVREARESETRRVQLEEAHAEQEELVQRLRKANQAKTRFLAHVSHDLRTPLALVRGPVEELLEGDLRPDVREQLETVLRNAGTLSSQVENLLAVAKTEAGSLEAELQSANLPEIVEGTAQHYDGHARGRGIDLRVETPDLLVASVDRDLLKRALLNLLSNAFEFTPDGGTVRCGLRRADDGRIEIVVADSGPGVPEAERDAVFERFRQGGDDTRPQGGTGLGLAIVREVAEAHQGSVRVDRAPEGGARFTLRLPARAVEDEAPAAATRTDVERDATEPRTEAAPSVHPARQEGGAPGVDPADERPTVLVVEDDADMARHLGRMLSADYRVVFAADGREGLERAVELEPDLVLTDVMMPEMDGPQMVRAIRERPALSGVPVLVLTARAEEELPERMLREGAQDYVLKPFRKGELRARVDTLIDQAASRRVLQEALASKEQSLEKLSRMASRRKEELERALEEKKVLMQELHHRVKGNLQTIASLLNLQLRTVQDERVRRPLEESRGRVATMGLLHQELYASGSPDRVELSGYLRSVVGDVVRERGARSTAGTSLSLEEVEVDADRGVACGLIVHELVTDVLRRAGSGDGPGTVRMSLRRDGGRVKLELLDPGTGIRREDPGSADALGMQLVESLVEQIGGTLIVRDDGDAEVEIAFPLEEPDGSGPTARRSPAGR